MHTHRVLIAVALVASSLAYAEGREPRQPVPSTLMRLHGATTLQPMPGGGLLAHGFSRLLMLRPRQKNWQVLHQIPGDHVYRVAVDKSDRVLAAWEKDPFLHVFTAGGKQHATIPLPPKPEGTIRYAADYVGFLPNGRDAVVFMEGEKIFNYHLNSVYRVALDGKSPPELLYQLDGAVKLDMNETLGLFLIPQDPHQRCEWLTCNPVAAVVAYEVTDQGVRQTTLVSKDEFPLSHARKVWGSDFEPVVMELHFKGQDRAMLHWRRGEPKARVRPFPKANDSTERFFAKSDELVELVRKGDGHLQLDVRRHPLQGGDPQVTTLTYPRGSETLEWSVHGLGLRKDGTLWLHWGDYLVLFPKGKPPVGYSIEPLLTRGNEWADADVYVPNPETLWVGLDNRARDFVRVSLDEVEKRARPF